METSPKPGWLTSECWVTVLGAVLTVAVAFGMISRADADHLQSLVVAALPAVIAIVTTFASVAQYAEGRVSLKKLHATAASATPLTINGPSFGPQLYEPPKGA